MKEIINEIVSDSKLHAMWLNSLSMMENCGARKISASQHPQEVNLIILKHAAEEARHAYYLKNQISKVNPGSCETYQLKELLAPLQSHQYLNRLDVSISKYLKEKLQLREAKLKHGAYLLVTYAIEVRADKLYPIYEEVLKEKGSKVSVRMIIAEEKGHLEEMIEQMDAFFGDWSDLGDYACKLEESLFAGWMGALGKSINNSNEVSESLAQ